MTTNTDGVVSAKVHDGNRDRPAPQDVPRRFLLYVQDCAHLVTRLLLERLSLVGTLDLRCLGLERGNLPSLEVLSLAHNQLEWFPLLSDAQASLGGYNGGAHPTFDADLPDVHRLWTQSQTWLPGASSFDSSQQHTSSHAAHVEGQLDLTQLWRFSRRSKPSPATAKGFHEASSAALPAADRRARQTAHWSRDQRQGYVARLQVAAADALPPGASDPATNVLPAPTQLPTVVRAKLSDRGTSSTLAAAQVGPSRSASNDRTSSPAGGALLGLPCLDLRGNSLTGQLFPNGTPLAAVFPVWGHLDLSDQSPACAKVGSREIDDLHAGHHLRASLAGCIVAELSCDASTSADVESSCLVLGLMNDQLSRFTVGVPGHGDSTAIFPSSIAPRDTQRMVVYLRQLSELLQYDSSVNHSRSRYVSRFLAVLLACVASRESERPINLAALGEFLLESYFALRRSAVLHQAASSTTSGLAVRLRPQRTVYTQEGNTFCIHL